MKNSMKVLAGVGIVAIIGGFALAGSYNSLVSKQATVESSLSNIDTQYQRRADLIPALVKTVEQAVTSERKTLDAVVSARAAATSVSPDNIEEYQAAQDKVSAGLGRLIAITESYPELKSTQGFLDLQAQLEGTENRITVARGDYNAAAKSYNVSISSFPTVIVAGMFGHGEKADYFKAAAGADKAPELEFGDTE